MAAKKSEVKILCQKKIPSYNNVMCILEQGHDGECQPQKFPYRAYVMKFRRETSPREE